MNAIEEISFLFQDQHFFESVFLPCLDKFFDMFEKKVFRPLPNLNRSKIPNEVGDEIFKDKTDPQMPFLSRLYAFYNTFLISELVQVRHLKVYMTSHFCSNWIELFDS